MARQKFRPVSEPPSEPLINMTPLIDVVFVLLIAFIVVAPLIEIDRIELAHGNRLDTHIPVRFEDAGKIQIQVTKDNQIMLNTRKVDVQELRIQLQELQKLYPGDRPQLFHDKRAFFGTYQDVKNSLEALGYKEVDIVLLPS